MEYSSSPSTSTSSRSKPISTSRPTSIPLPVQSIVSRKATSTAVNSGVNRRVSTGAMFSMTLCLASTSQALMRTAPTTPHGSTHDATSRSASSPMAWKMNMVKPMRTPPPRAISDVVDEPLAREADEVHPPAGVAPAAAAIGVAHGQPQRDRQVEGRQDLGVPAGLERQHVDDHRGRGKRQEQPEAAGPPEDAFPREVASQQRQREEAQVAHVERAFGALPQQADAEELGQLDRQRGGNRQADRDDRLPAGLGAAHRPSGETTSCFQSRSEYSRANSRDNESRSPMRLTATRNASSSARPASRSAPIWSRR